MSHVIVHKKIINKANAVMSENVYEQAIIPPSGPQCLPIPSLNSLMNIVAKLHVIIKAEPLARDFQQFGIFTSVDSGKPVQPPYMLRNSK